MRKVSKEFDCETRGEEWWREAVKEQRETGQSETKKTLKLVLKSMTQWNRERIRTVFDPVSVKNQTIGKALGAHRVLFQEENQEHVTFFMIYVCFAALIRQ